MFNNKKCDFLKLTNIIKNYLFKLGYELINFIIKPNKLFRIFINFSNYIKIKRYIKIYDCEIISNYLKYILNIENINFNFLEISSYKYKK